MVAVATADGIVIARIHHQNTTELADSIGALHHNVLRSLLTLHLFFENI